MTNSERENEVVLPPLAAEVGLEDFIRDHKNPLLRAAIAHTRNLHDADEVLTMTFYEVYKKWPRVKAHPNPIALVRTMLWHNSKNFYRTEARRKDNLPLEAAPDGPTVDDLLFLRGHDRLDAALEQLDSRAEKQAKCIRLHFQSGLTHDEIAAELSITTKAVQANIYKGLKRLKSEFELMDRAALGDEDS
ncbi:RNA polymerase sigma-70 factor, ECF subfamily [Streptomyces sp. TverLS-915]|uniref:RNA polymerase sigma factor n=1 Tax=Streptomyces sp. TverLS-915 TaxID=1839763 RepID=UPI00081D98CF|nr:sigma-70 family RNA polymerase sigma factor [Streptomyces sp. TverLS-915]SCD48940.1 RNA polymerase sigma-70 factor, ECF subfamily [Streptomyces sp. TverLS-915]